MSTRIVYSKENLLQIDELITLLNQHHIEIKAQN